VFDNMEGSRRLRLCRTVTWLDGGANLEGRKGNGAEDNVRK